MKPASYYYRTTPNAVLINRDVNMFPMDIVGNEITSAIAAGKELIEAEYIEGYGLLDPRPDDETDMADMMQAHMEAEYSNPQNW